ncbi:MAG TPA: nucleotidyltransferase family protein [Sphingomicrobium sp.]|nr:nucleotidyltransferase family protein [Sphingomicrobium sp.]
MDAAEIDDFLAATLRGSSDRWPDEWAPADVSDLAYRRIAYHGIAGLLWDDKASLESWPDELKTRIRQQAVGQAMWEIRHREALLELTEAAAARELDALLLKGTAIAYQLYSNPSARTRGDSDLLVRHSDLHRARALLSELGYDRPFIFASAERLMLQEMWTKDTAGAAHVIDLHWSPLNSMALRQVLTFDDCWADRVSLPRLCEAAVAPDPSTMLLHSCLHRAMHVASPYDVDGVTYYGGDRLIWLQDIHLLANALTDEQWRRFCVKACSSGAAPICLVGLAMAQDRLGTPVPSEVRAALTEPGRTASRYLESGQFRRAIMDVRSLAGFRYKLAYARERLLPHGKFLRAKYPDMAHRHTGFLVLRRALDFFRDRSRQGDRG